MITPPARSIAVLVPEAHAIGMVGVIRSLGRAGHAVHACASRSDAIGFRSRFATCAAVCPDYGESGFTEWLRFYVRNNDIETIIPSEAFLRAIRSDFEEFAPLMPVSQDPEVVYGAIGKTSVYRNLLDSPSTQGNLPPIKLIDPDDPTPTTEDLDALGLPLFIKADGIHSTAGDGDEIHRANTPGEGVAILTALRARYNSLVVQGFVPGRGAGVCLLRWNGEILMEFMNTCEHEVPHTGGFCSLRTSWYHEDMLADARTKLTALDWQGVAMLEYRWDERTGEFWLVEVNARFWAALHLALFAGADFPISLVNAHQDRQRAQEPQYKHGVRARLTAPFEISYLLSRWRDRSLTLQARSWTVFEFLVLFLDPRVRSDLLFPGDRRLYWIQWGRIMKYWYEVVISRAARMIGTRPAAPTGGGDDRS